VDQIETHSKNHTRRTTHSKNYQVPPGDFYVSIPQSDASLAAVPTLDQYDPAGSAQRAYDTPLGITNPPIDELLDRVSSKYALVIYAAKRARQINDYYNQLGEGILEYVGPLVEPGLQEKPLSIAMREIHADLLEHTEGE
jgi:DNA-directed RNA polymerase subunit omega